MLLHSFITCQPVNLIHDRKFIPVHYHRMDKRTVNLLYSPDSIEITSLE